MEESCDVEDVEDFTYNICEISMWEISHIIYVKSHDSSIYDVYMSYMEESCDVEDVENVLHTLK